MPSRSIERWNRRLAEHPHPADLHRRERRLSREREFIVLDDGKVRVIHLLLRPRVMRRRQVAFLERIARAVGSVQRRVARAWLKDARLQRVLPLREEERRFFGEAGRSPLAFRSPVVSRLDASIALDRPSWREDLRLFEVNSVGVGGLFLTPVAQGLLKDLSFPVLEEKRSLRLGAGPDLRELLGRLLLKRARALHGHNPTVALVEDRRGESGTVEFDSLHRFFGRRGLPVVLADVRELSADRGILRAGGKKIDLLYRDVELSEVLALKDRPVRAAFLRAFQEGRVISGLQGELDHKSLWEVLTDRTLSAFVSTAERRLLRSTALWTRLLYPRRTTDPSAREVDLERFVRKNREDLVLKPNRAYGGKGVTPGVDCSAASWERALERAWARPGTWVVQSLGEVMVEEFAVLSEEGTVQLPYHVDCGVYQIGDGFGVLTRAAQQRVVNVSRGGGYAVMFYQ